MYCVEIDREKRFRQRKIKTGSKCGNKVVKNLQNTALSAQP